MGLKNASIYFQTQNMVIILHVCEKYNPHFKMYVIMVWCYLSICLSLSELCTHKHKQHNYFTFGRILTKSFPGGRMVHFAVINGSYVYSYDTRNWNAMYIDRDC